MMKGEKALAWPRRAGAAEDDAAPAFLTRRQFVAGVTAVSALALQGGCVTQPGSPRSTVPFVDGLSFMPDLTRNPQALVESGLCSFILDVSKAQQLPTEDGSIRYWRTFEACAQSIEAMRLRLAEMNGVFLATRGSEIRRAYRDGTIAVFFQFQGCEPIGEDLSRIDYFYERGLRVLQITHHNDNAFGGGALERHPRGLTALGHAGVERMNQLGILPDVSHASDETALDVIKASKSPVILSHGAARSIVRNARCAPDDVIRAIGDSGGVMGIFMLSFWLTEDKVPTVEHLLQQIRHVEKVAGSEAVGIGNDFTVAGHEPSAALGNVNSEAVKPTLPWWESVGRQGVLGYDTLPSHYVIPELNNPRRMFVIQRALEQAGYTPARIERILGGNWIRVLSDVLG